MPRELQPLSGDGDAGGESPASDDTEELAPLSPQSHGSDDGDIGPRDATSIMARLLEQDFEMPDRNVPDDVPDSVKALHPYGTTLSAQHVDACVALENAAFPPNHRATKEKFEYRLTRCGECCMGLFTSADEEDESGRERLSAATAEQARPVDSTAPKRRGVLLAQLIATKSKNGTIHDSDMMLPDGAGVSSGKVPVKGHDEEGRTLCIHSLAVVPQFQKRGLGATLLKAYIQRMVSAEFADRISLLAEDELVEWYERFGFENRGKSKDATFGGTPWNDMVLDLKDLREKEDEEED